MERSGVRPLAGRGGKDSGRRAQKPAPARSVVPPARPGVAPTPLQTAAPAARTAPSAPRETSAAVAMRSGEGRAELWAELERLRAELEQRDRSVRELKSGLEAEQRARQALESERDALRGTSESARAALDAATARVTTLEAEYEETDQHRRSLQRALDAARTGASGPPRGAREIFEARGLVGDSEIDVILRGLVEQRAGASLLALLETSDPAALDALLQDRVALVCDDPLCAAPPGRAVLRVVPARCDVCSGSDIRKAIRRFQDAALLNGLSRLVIVGGSPQYHRQLRALIVEPRLRVSLVPGDRRRTNKQAQADEEGADLVILWGATMLDHSISELYGRGKSRVLRVPHRGIARMLLMVADALA